MTLVRKPRIVRGSEIDRILDKLAARGIEPAAFDILPGGIVRLHRLPPGDQPESDAGEAGWDVALGE